MGLRFVLRPSRNIYHNGTPQDFPGVLVGSNTVIVVLVSCPMNSFGLQWISNLFLNKLSIASWIIISGPIGSALYPSFCVRDTLGQLVNGRYRFVSYMLQFQGGVIYGWVAWD